MPWKCAVLALVCLLCPHVGAAPEPVFRGPVILRVAAQTGTNKALAAKASALLAEGLRREGVEVFPDAPEAGEAMMLHLEVAFGEAPTGTGHHVAILGGWSPTRMAEGHSPQVSVEARGIVSREEDLDLGQACLGVARQLLGRPSPEPRTWSPIGVGAPAGTPVPGRSMQLEHAPPFQYPAEVRRDRIQGSIGLQLLVDVRGEVSAVAVTSGPEPLAAHGLRYAKTLRFKIPAELKAKAPLTFGMTLGYRFPEVSKVTCLTLEVVEGPLLEKGLLPPAAELRQEVRRRLADEGIVVLDDILGERPVEARHLRIKVESVRLPGDVHVYAATATLTERPPDPVLGQGGQGTEFGLVAGQRGIQGLQEGFQTTMAEAVRGVVLPSNPKPLKAPAAPPKPVSETPTLLEFSQIRVKRQPPAPPYPMAAKARRIQGTVVVQLNVGVDGLPTRAVAVEGPSELLMTALGYALNWEFEPARLNGVPQAARFRLSMPFRLR